MPKLWKIWREVKRILRKVVWFPYVLTRHWIDPRLYDLIQRKQVRVHAGALPMGSRVAIYLLFPRQGLLASHLAAIGNIVASGYSPVVVSNLPLSDMDLGTLRDTCAIVVERPNIGYDFGGYREAILLLRDRLPGLDRLAILNDSAWFPLRPGQHWLTEAEALGRDFVGAIGFGNVTAVDAEDFRTAPWDYKPMRPRFHYCSFAWSMGPRILRHRGFLRFWRAYPLPSDKHATVKKGEMGFSRWVIRNGFSHAATFDQSRLAEEFGALDDAELRHHVTRTVVMDNLGFQRLRDRLLQAPDTSRADLLGFLIAAAGRIGPPYSTPSFNIERKDFGFLKKLPVRMNPGDAKATLAVAADLPGPMAEIIRAEVAAMTGTP